ncbi:MAG: DPP IV N-terminal domain-containing protein [Planctomycetota bacterium]|nr:DPP IV N-terminal domain-containing protein [Planctomycetota bacterium]
MLTQRALVVAGIAGTIVLNACTSGGQRDPQHRTSVGRDSAGQAAAPDIERPAPSAADPAFLEQFAATNRFRLGLPTSIKPLPGGRHVLFLRSGPRSFVHDLYEYDIASGAERVLLTAERILGGGDEKLTPEELARRERMRLSSRGIAGYDVSRDGSRILVPLSGRLFVIERQSGQIRELRSTAGFPIDPRFSPDGSTIACVRDGELHVTDVDSGNERRVTTGADRFVENGVAEFVAQEEMDRREGYWWSPEGDRIVFQQTDTRGVERFHIADPVNPEKDPQTSPYPRAGRTNAAVKLGIAVIRGTFDGAVVWVNWNSQQYPYLARVDWSRSAPLTILVQNRTQTEQALLEVNPVTGDTRELLVERDPAWINLHDPPRWLPDGSAFLWTSDAGTDERLELRARDCALIRVLAQNAPGPLTNIKLASLDAARNRALFTASPNPLETRRWQVPLDGSAAPSMLPSSSDPAVETLEVAPDGSSWVWTSDRFDRSTQFFVGTLDRDRAGELRSVAESPAFRPKAEFTTVAPAGSNVELQAVIMRPRNFRPGVKHPVILSVYTGPGLQYVTAAPRGGLLDQWYADHGFIVIRVDNRGTPGRGRDFERAIKGNLIDLALAEQAGAVQALARRYPEIDASRVGVYGWSFGGYFSAMAAMRRPDVFKAGVAGAPVCDWADYDTHYTERFMGLPDANAEGYRASNVLTYCKDLEVPLLVIHGTADDNVYFLHSLKMTDALFRAGKHFEFLALPGFTHMVPDPVVTRSLYGRIAEFFATHLADDPR